MLRPIIKPLLVLLVLASAAPPASWGTTTTADSGNLVDVQFAVNNAARGDTIIIPPGSYNWSGSTGLRINRGFNITLQGGNGTTGQRPIIDGTGLSDNFVTATVSNTTTKTTMRITNIELAGFGDRLRVNGIGTVSFLSPSGVYAGGIRIDHNRFSQPYWNNNGHTITDGAFTNLGKTITSSGNHFLSSDLNHYVYGLGIGLYPKITSVATGGGSITVDTACDQTITSGATVGVTGGLTGLGAGGGPSGKGQWLNQTGWVFGVADHNELDWNMIPNLPANGEVNHERSPDAAHPGQFGDYAASYLPAGRTDIAASLDAMVFEDNIIHRGAGGFTDTGSGTAGGGIIIARHNTTFATVAVHGTRESGGAQFGGQLIEYYNNIYCQLPKRLQYKMDVNAIEARDGEQIAYNNVIQMQIDAQDGLNSTKTVLIPDNCGPNTIAGGSNTNWFYFGGDGLNPLDLNAKGDYTDPESGDLHHPYAGYNNSVTDAASFVIGTTDTVNAGVDNSNGGMYSDVYGKVTGGSIVETGSFSTGWTLTGVNIAGTGFPSPIPANFFRGFVVRNADVTRYSSSATNFAFSYIVSSTVPNSSTGTSITGINLGLAHCNPCNGGNPKLGYTAGGAHNEIRRVAQYFGGSGRGALTADITENSSPKTYATGSPAARWVPMTGGGNWSWGNMRRVGNGASSYENDIATNGVYYFLHRYNHRVQGGSGQGTAAAITPVVTMGTNGPIQGLFDRGYKWYPNVTAGAGNPGTRIGADWSKDFVDPVTGEIAFTNTSGMFASFYKNGSSTDGIGIPLPYPHPLVSAPATSAPAFDPPYTSTFTTGVGKTFLVHASGNPAPSITKTAGTLPANVTLSSTVPATGTEAIQGTTTASAGSYPITLTAHNTSGADAVQGFTITVDSPTGVTLDTPSNGALYFDPAIIDLTASLTGNPSQVDFYNGATKIGSDASPDVNSEYEFIWTNPPVGTFDLHAKVGSADSNHATVTVSAAPTPTPPGVIVIKP